MKIVTISREFGSGGRELGKRLADALGVACYDHEIVDMVAQRHGFDRAYVDKVSEKDIRVFYPSTIAHRLITPHPASQQTVRVMTAEHDIIRQVAAREDCVIVGRCADVILRDFQPLNLFVYADSASKLTRCKARAHGEDTLSDKEFMRRMKQVDKERAAYRGLFTEETWGDKAAYHLCVNTSGREIKALVPALAGYVNAWFDAR